MYFAFQSLDRMAKCFSASWAVEKDFCSSGEPANAQRRPLTEITPPLYNPKPLLCGGQEVKQEHRGSTDKQMMSTILLDGSFPVCVLQCCVVIVYRYTTAVSSSASWPQPAHHRSALSSARAQRSHLSMSPDMICLQHRDTASLNLSEAFLLPPPHTRKDITYPAHFL